MNGLQRIRVRKERVIETILIAEQLARLLKPLVPSSLSAVQKKGLRKLAEKVKECASGLQLKEEFCDAVGDTLSKGLEYAVGAHLARHRSYSEKRGIREWPARLFSFCD
jgi:hypothetical protein